MIQSLKVKVEVTAADIGKGCTRAKRQGQSDNCAIARAVVRALKDIRGVYDVAVGGSDISFETSDTSYAGVGPVKCDKFVIAYDAGSPVEPFSFAITFRASR